MLFVTISCADDMSWLITTRAIIAASESLRQSDLIWTLATDIIRSARRALFSLGVALRAYLSVVFNDFRYRSDSLSWF